MIITPKLFGAFLKCPTKCWLLSQGEADTGNEYANWVKTQNETFRAEAVRRLIVDIPPDECVSSPPETENLKTPKWRIVVDFVAHTQNLESKIHAVERMPSQGRGKAVIFIPIRFVFTNKLTRHDKLLVAFDDLVLSEHAGKGGRLGKIIHGDNYSTLKVKTSALASEVRKRIESNSALLSGSTPPDLVLNRHCGECEFQKRCREKAIEKDDLSLLSGMSDKERKKLHSKGIFTVTQLSYTFRPRRRPKRLRDKKKKYHHALKALAIREKKIHIVGTPELKIDGTPVYLDVEGLPDRDFYYLIGVRVGNGEDAVQHSLWADTVEDEGKMWREFLAIVATVEKPVLIHYGSYETKFLEDMAERYGEPMAESFASKTVKSAVNILSKIFAQVYFPTYSNGLKEVAGYLGFRWSASNASGLKTIGWRDEWDRTRAADMKGQLLKYNADDCQALEQAATAFLGIGPTPPERADAEVAHPVVHTELLPHQTMWPRFKSPFVEFEQVNKAARWDYQRDRVFVRSDRLIRRRALRKQRVRPNITPKLVGYREQELCPVCRQKGYRHSGTTRRTLFDIYFGRFNIRRRIVEYSYHVYWCPKCRKRFGIPPEFWPESKYGRNLMAYLLYQVVKLFVPSSVLVENVNRFFGLSLTQQTIHEFKVRAAKYYLETRNDTLNHLLEGHLLHVDETRVSIKGRTGFIWVFTSLHEVVYLYADTREGQFVRDLLQNFHGVLVSDFYAAYETINCPQQKCLLHLMRDINDAILSEPYNEETKEIARSFAELLRTIIATVDRWGLKKHFLRKHRVTVKRFYRQLRDLGPQTVTGVAWKERFEKNRDTLFTFLDYDNVPWNNNNAEHAIKAVAHLRDLLRGSCTADAFAEYLVLLSVCQTCKYQGLDFLDFLRSGEKDIHEFAETKGRRKPRIAPISENTMTGGG